MHSLVHAGAITALSLSLSMLIACSGAPPTPAAPPSGKGWRILAEGSVEVTVRSSNLGRNGSRITSATVARLDDSPKEEGMTEDDPPRQLTVGHNIAEITFHPSTAAGKP
jgi:hypothetical protein